MPRLRERVRKSTGTMPRHPKTAVRSFTERNVLSVSIKTPNGKEINVRLVKRGREYHCLERKTVALVRRKGLQISVGDDIQIGTLKGVITRIDCSGPSTDVESVDKPPKGGLGGH